jgi:hypothetical protein
MAETVTSSRIRSSETWYGASGSIELTSMMMMRSGARDDNQKELNSSSVDNFANGFFNLAGSCEPCPGAAQCSMVRL